MAEQRAKRIRLDSDDKIEEPGSDQSEVERTGEEIEVRASDQSENVESISREINPEEREGRASDQSEDIESIIDSAEEVRASDQSEETGQEVNELVKPWPKSKAKNEKFKIQYKRKRHNIVEVPEPASDQSEDVETTVEEINPEGRASDQSEDVETTVEETNPEDGRASDQSEDVETTEEGRASDQSEDVETTDEETDPEEEESRASDQSEDFETTEEEESRASDQSEDVETTDEEIYTEEGRASYQSEQTGHEMTNKSDGYNCSICCDTFESNDFEFLICGHSFHRFCISSWLSVKRACPLCKTFSGGTSFDRENRRDDDSWPSYIS